MSTICSDHASHSFSVIAYFLFLTVLLCFSATVTAQGESPAVPTRLYQVIKIIDGDTFDATDGNIKFRVRIAGMDAPEKGSPFSKLTTLELKKQLEGKKIEIKSVGRGLDRYNRALGQVMVDGRDIGIELIEMGLATYYRPGGV